MTRKLQIEYDIHGYMCLYLFRFLFSAFLASVALSKSPFGSSWILEKGKQISLSILVESVIIFKRFKLIHTNLKK